MDVTISEPIRQSEPRLPSLGQGASLAALSADCPNSVDLVGSVAKPSATLLTYSRWAKLNLDTPVLHSPSVQRSLRPLNSGSAPRQSQRLAAKSKKMISEGQHTQLLLARELGFSQDHSAALAKFKELFDTHLSQEHIVALAAIFRIPVPTSLPFELTELPTAEAVEEHPTPLPLSAC